MLDKERNYYGDSVSSIVGVDEAGRGPWAGPVFAGAVVFPRDFASEEINDSKQLSAKKREELFDLILANALGYGIARVEARDIDRLDIYEATKVCMKIAISQIHVPYQLIITDAMPLKNLDVPVVPLIKGDATCLNVAAASILAKVSRDRYMTELESTYPMFSFAKHKGYGTKAHREELEKYGPIPLVHRDSYAPIAELRNKDLALF